MLVYSDAPFMSLQGHPEFDDAFASALYGARRGGSLTDDQVDAAIVSLGQPEDRRLAADWIVAFLRAHARRA